MIALTLIGAFFRFYNLNWDKGFIFHPDEENIANSVSQIKLFSQLNPHFFAYGGFSIYLYKIFAVFISFLTGNNSWQYSLSKIILIGRYFSAFFSTLTIIFIYALSAKLFSRRVGLLAAFLSAFTVGFIQQAHFATTESLLIMLSVLLCFLSLRLLETSALKYYIYCAVILGISIAVKITGLSFAVFPFLAHFLSLRLGHKNILKRANYLLIFIVLTVIVSIFFSPFSILDWRDFIASLKYESSVATGLIKVFYTLQFKGTDIYLFQLKNFFWQMGIFSIVGIIGFIYLVYKAIIFRNKRYSLFLSFPLIYFLYVGSWYAKFIRYMVPVIPFLIITGVYILDLFYRRNKKVGLFLIILICTLTLFWAMAFFSIYQRPQTRIEASKWIYKNIKPGARILTEKWDYILPISLGNAVPAIYNNTAFDMYSLQDKQKDKMFAEQLSKTDYIVLSSRRVYKTLMRLTKDYPFASRYYNILFAGDLGFKEVSEFSSYPSLFGITINDDGSEETFQVFDHPKVIIFKNEKHFSQHKINKILNI